MHLGDGFVDPALTERRTLALNEDDRDPVHEDHSVRSDGCFRPLHRELTRDDQFVVIGLLEVDETNRLPALAGTYILLKRDTVGKDRVELLVRLDQARS